MPPTDTSVSPPVPDARDLLALRWRHFQHLYDTVRPAMDALAEDASLGATSQRVELSQAAMLLETLQDQIASCHSLATSE